MSEGLPTVPPTSANGATVQSEYMGRTMRCYPVHETEMDGLIEANGDATSHFAMSSACVAFGVGIVTNAAFTEKLTPAGELATKLAAPVLLVLALYFVVLGLRARARRERLWTKIKREAVTLQATASSPVPTAQAA